MKSHLFVNLINIYFHPSLFILKWEFWNVIKFQNTDYKKIKDEVDFWWNVKKKNTLKNYMYSMS